MIKMRKKGRRRRKMRRTKRMTRIRWAAAEQ